jgi:hypothetical protein
MNKRMAIILGGAGVAAVAILGGVTAAGMGGDDDEPLTGEPYDKAVDAALAHTGEGDVIETEGGDDGAAYGVEVRLNDGTVVEVELDSDFKVIGTEVDDDEGEEDGEDDD